MKITFLPILFLVFNWSVTAQITNLYEFVEISQAPIVELMNYFQYGWEIDNPEETISNNTATGTYTFRINYDEGHSNQKLKRETRINLDTGFRMESTRLICNELKLYNKILEELEDYGFKLKLESKEGKLFYSNGILKVIINSNKVESLNLDNGEYIISIAKI
jgi:hypothetical protein